MSCEEVIYEAPPESEVTNPDLQDNSSYFMSLRSDERHVDGPVSSDNLATSSDENDIVLCALWQSGYLGAAYYSCQESELYVLSDVIDLKPDYIVTRNLFNKIKPSFTITLGTMASKFVCALSCIAQRLDLEDDDLSSAIESVTSLPPNVQLLKKNKYSLDLCIHAVQTLKLSSEPADLTDDERRMYIQSLLNFDKKVSMQALGALIIFLKTSGGFITKSGQISFLNINQISINDLVLMNLETFESLEIFNSELRSGMKTEGQSIFKLFNRCRSTIGHANLKNMLLSPTNDIVTLNKRHEFIEFCLKPINSEIVSTIQECLSNIFPITVSIAFLLISNKKGRIITGLFV